MAAKINDYLQQQYQNQLELNQKQKAMGTRMEERSKLMAEQYQMLQMASEVISQQSAKLEHLTSEIMSPKGQSRWGWFAKTEDAA